MSEALDTSSRLEVRRSTRDDLMSVAASLIAEFSDRVPAGTVIRCLARARERLLANGVRAGLAPAAESAARMQLAKLVSTDGEPQQSRGVHNSR